jgi:signal transduction histidine kinase
VRTPIRLRLALAHAFVFAVMATALIAGVYELTAHSISSTSDGPRLRAEQILGLPSGSLLGRRPSGHLLPSPSFGPRRPNLGQIAAGVQAQTRSALLGRVLLFSVALVAVTTILTFIVGWFPARQSLKPLRRITARARTLSETNLDEPIGLDGPRDELRELAETFDEMLARLERAFAAQRLFAANASHELRAPLARIRAKLDVTLAEPTVSRDELEEMATTIRDAIDRSTELIDALMTLTRAQGQLERQVVLLDDLVRTAVIDIDEAVNARRVSITSSLSPCPVRGDAILLEHLVRNVLDNAVTHNVDGGWVDVLVERDHVVRLSVSNGGPTIPRSSTEELFLPLHRGESDRLHVPGGGFGLGLAIVRAVAEAHGGSVSAEPLADGGLVIDVELPADHSADHSPPIAAEAEVTLGI